MFFVFLSQIILANDFGQALLEQQRDLAGKDIQKVETEENEGRLRIRQDEQLSLFFLQHVIPNGIAINFNQENEFKIQSVLEKVFSGKYTKDENYFIVPFSVLYDALHTEYSNPENAVFPVGPFFFDLQGVGNVESDRFVSPAEPKKFLKRLSNGKSVYQVSFLDDSKCRYKTLQPLAAFVSQAKTVV